MFPLLAGVAVAFAQSRATQPSNPPEDGAISTVYSDLLKRTEHRLHLVPATVEREPPPFTLDFWVEYDGRQPKRSAAAIQVRAQSDLGHYPTRLRQASLAFRTDAFDIDLTGNGRTYLLNYPCGPGSDAACSFDGISASLDGVEFLRLAHARSIAGTALGFEFQLTAGQIARLRAFSQSIDPR